MTLALPITWPIPDPTSLFSQAAGIYEGQFPGIDARSSFSVASTNCRIYAMGTYDLYLMQGNLAQELMVNTAVAWLPFHAALWQVPQLQPTQATGNVVFAGTPATPIPSGTVMSYQPLGWLYTTTASVDVGAGSTVSAPVISALAGAAYNLPADTVLNLLTPISGLSPQSGTADGNGIEDGTDLEEIDAWRARIKAKIGQPGSGGDGKDYLTWAFAAGAAFANVVPQAIGPGSVGLYIAAPGPSVASDQLVEAVQNYLGVYGTTTGTRPVCANAQVMAATLVPVNIELHLNPNTALTQAAATAALQLFFAQSANGLFGPDQAQNNTPPDNTLYFSRLDSAVSSGSGAYEQDFYEPAPGQDITFLPSQIFVLGDVNFL